MLFALKHAQRDVNSLLPAYTRKQKLQVAVIDVKWIFSRWSLGMPNRIRLLVSACIASNWVVILPLISRIDQNQQTRSSKTEIDQWSNVIFSRDFLRKISLIQNNRIIYEFPCWSYGHALGRDKGWAASPFEPWTYMETWREREHHLNVPETENSWELGEAICHRTSAENQFQLAATAE